jgi:hypothetical protein
METNGSLVEVSPNDVLLAREWLREVAAREWRSEDFHNYGEGFKVRQSEELVRIVVTRYGLPEALALELVTERQSVTREMEAEQAKALEAWLREEKREPNPLYRICLDKYPALDRLLIASIHARVWADKYAKAEADDPMSQVTDEDLREILTWAKAGRPGGPGKGITNDFDLSQVPREAIRAVLRLMQEHPPQRTPVERVD